MNLLWYHTMIISRYRDTVNSYYGLNLLYYKYFRVENPLGEELAKGIAWVAIR